jgi:serine/threonine protein kinase
MGYAVKQRASEKQEEEQQGDGCAIHEAAMYTGQRFGNYTLRRLIGRGGFAEVYLGEHRYLKTPAAVKILTTPLTQGEIAQFRNEARLMMSLEHPHILRVFDFGMQDHVPFLVTAYAAGGSLRDRYPRGSRLALPDIVLLVQQVADALQYLHDHKLIHRDVKPENLLLTRDNTVVLSDFGIAVVAHSERSLRQQGVGGTGVYMAPEVFAGKPRLASDQYALGIVVYEWLTGAPPFRGSLAQLAYRHASTPPPPLRAQRAVSPQVEQVVFKALAKAPFDRFSSVQEFAHALEEASRTAKTHRSSQSRLAGPKKHTAVLAPSAPTSPVVLATPIASSSPVASALPLTVPATPVPAGERSCFSPFSSHDQSLDALLPVKRARKRWLLPAVLILITIFMCSGVAVGVGTATIQLVAHMTGSGMSNGGHANTVATFLNNLMRQDYAQAYQQLAPSVLLTMTEEDLARQAQADDHCYGTIRSYAEAAHSETTSQGEQTMAYRLTRSKLTYAYILSFTLQHDPGSGQWLIASYGKQNESGPAPPTC